MGQRIKESLAAHQAEFRNPAGPCSLHHDAYDEQSQRLSSTGQKIDQLQEQGPTPSSASFPAVISYVPQDCDSSTELGTNALGTALF